MIKNSKLWTQLTIVKHKSSLTYESSVEAMACRLAISSTSAVYNELNNNFQTSKHQSSCPLIETTYYHFTFTPIFYSSAYCKTNILNLFYVSTFFKVNQLIIKGLNSFKFVNQITISVLNHHNQWPLTNAIHNNF